MNNDLNIRFVGNIITQPLGKLKAAVPDRKVRVSHAGIDQLHQTFAEAQSPLSSDGDSQPDVLIVHLTTEHFLSMAPLVSPLDRMSELLQQLAAFLARSRALVFLNTMERRPQRFVGLDYFRDLKLLNTLDHMLYDFALRHSRVSILDVGGLVAELGFNHALREQSRLVMRLPYSKLAIDAINAGYSQLLRERFLPRKKVLVVDADNTLWQGIVGEDGVSGIGIDKEFPGGVYWGFQEQLKALRLSGVVLALVSKNNEEDVREAFEKRSMPLSWSDFTAFRVNWNPKSQNIAEIAAQLSLGLDSFVFVDDNIFEIEQVRTALPQVVCIQIDGSDADGTNGLLGQVQGLQTWSVTDEDKAKAEQYAVESQRQSSKSETGSLEDYLKSLNICVTAHHNDRSNIKRISQLTNKTNQFNLTTKRYSESEIQELMETANVFDFKVEDKFGDMGIVGVAIVKDDVLDSFLMSCRVLGRKIESALLRYVCDKIGNDKLKASYLPTAKNKLVAAFLKENGFTLAEQVGYDEHYKFSGGPQMVAEIELTES